jgi:hypothetical protein
MCGADLFNALSGLFWLWVILLGAVPLAYLLVTGRWNCKFRAGDFPPHSRPNFVAVATKFWRGKLQFYRRGSFATKFGQSPSPVAL